MTEPKKPLRQMAEQMFGNVIQPSNVNVNTKYLEHVEFMILRKYLSKGHKDGRRDGAGAVGYPRSRCCVNWGRRD